MNCCQATKFKVACLRNSGGICIQDKMTVKCKTHILHKLFEGNLSIANKVEVGRLRRCLVLLEVQA